MIATADITIKLTKESRLSSVDFNHLAFGKIMSDHMLVADFINGEWQNVSIQPYGNLSLSPANASLHYGQLIFEGLKAFKTEDNRVVSFRAIDNFYRINKSAERMCMPTLPEEIFMGGLKKLLQIDKAWVPNTPGASLYIRPFMMAMDEGVGMRPSETYKFIIFTCPVAAYYADPVKVKIETHYTRAANGGVGFSKNAGNYGASMYPFRLVHEKGYDQLIWTDSKEHKYVEESGTMNLMFVIDNKLVTPPVGDTILDGVTRKSIIQVAKDWGMAVEERKISIEEVMQTLQSGRMTEAFGAGTAATMAPIKAIALEDLELPLKPMDENSFGTKVKRYLTDLCKGKVADTHNWLFWAD
jgi:branched-chain amino acid aminotransferase